MDELLNEFILMNGSTQKTVKVGGALLQKEISFKNKEF